MGQGWHEDPSGKDCQTWSPAFSTKEEVVIAERRFLSKLHLSITSSNE